MRFNGLSTAGMRLGVFGVAVAGGTAARAALVESLPLNGTTAAAVGTDGVAVNGPTVSADVYGTAGGATTFTRTYDDGSYVDVPGGGGLAGLSEGTMAFWVKWDGYQRSGVAGGFGAVTSRQLNGSFSGDVVALDGSDPSSAHLTFRHDSGFDLTGSTVVGNDAWNFVAVTFTPTTENLYLNGTLDGTAVGDFSDAGQNAADLTLGAWPGDGYEYSTSSLSDFQVYDSALTAPQVATLSAGGVPEPGALATVAVGGVGLLGRRIGRK